MRSFFVCTFAHDSEGGFAPVLHASICECFAWGTGGVCKNEKPMRKGVGVSGCCSQIENPISPEILGIGGRAKNKPRPFPLQGYARPANISDTQGKYNLVNTTKIGEIISYGNQPRGWKSSGDLRGNVAVIICTDSRGEYA